MMKEVCRLSPEEVLPERDAVLRAQGIPPDEPLPARTEALLAEAIDHFLCLSKPAGVFAEIPLTQFGEVYAGEGLNDLETPVADVYPGADGLALFAATLGDHLSKQILDQFRIGNYARGSMLDSVASEGTIKLAGKLESCYQGLLEERGVVNSSTRIMGYSPGYCGWHLSGQTRLFQYLLPEEIGITLGSSFLMQPIKSVSGVLIAGPVEIHLFEKWYPSCQKCGDRACGERIEELLRG